MKRLLLIFNLILLLSSCMQDIMLDYGTSERITVDCVLKMQDVQSLRLYVMKEKYGKDAKPITDAKVTLSIYDEDGDEYSEAAQFKYYNDVEWRASYRPEYGRRYKLEVEIPDNDTTITAETVFPKDLRLMLSLGYKSIGRSFNDCNEPNHEGKGLKSVPPGVYRPAEYPEIICYEVHQSSWVVDPDGTHYFNFEKKIVDGKPVPFKVYWDRCEDSCKMWIFPHVEPELDKEHHPDKVKNPFYHYSELYDYKGSSKPYVKYVTTDHPGVDNFNLTSGTVSDLKWCRPLSHDDTDIAQIRRWPRTICPDLPLYNNFLHIAHPARYRKTRYPHEIEYDDFYGKSQRSTFYIIADYDYQAYSEWQDFNSMLIETHFVSEEYDKYMRDLYAIRLDNSVNFILSAYESKHVYSNIKGGYGIFGADNVTWDQPIGRVLFGVYDSSPVEMNTSDSL